jgi:hypothetical protein
MTTGLLSCLDDLAAERPLSIATPEDRIVQRAVLEVPNAIYEEDFLGFSYGFRPGRSPHGALDALSVGIVKKKVSSTHDADIPRLLHQLGSRLASEVSRGLSACSVRRKGRFGPIGFGLGPVGDPGPGHTSTRSGPS